MLKKFCWKLFQERLFQSAACLHCTAESEKAAVKKLGLRTPVAMIPNAVELDEFEALPPRSEALRVLGLKKTRKYILFLSRIHPKKGLEYLVENWLDLASEKKEWDLLICGPINDRSYYRSIKQKVDDTGFRDRFHFTEMLNHEKRLAAYAVASLFVLPSHTENFGIVIAEAMAAQLPVITTKGTPWSELEDYDCGWWIELNRENLKNALDDALHTADAELAAKGKRARKLIADKYTWDRQSQKMKEVYSWVLGEGKMPDCVACHST